MSNDNSHAGWRLHLRRLESTESRCTSVPEQERHQTAINHNLDSEEKQTIFLRSLLARWFIRRIVVVVVPFALVLLPAVVGLVLVTPTLLIIRGAIGRCGTLWHVMRRLVFSILESVQPHSCQLKSMRAPEGHGPTAWNTQQWICLTYPPSTSLQAMLAQSRHMHLQWTWNAHASAALRFNVNTNDGKPRTGACWPFYWMRLQ